MTRICFFLTSLVFINCLIAFEEGEIGHIKFLNVVDERIQKETKKIQELESLDADVNDNCLEVYNERGISYFLKKDYISALSDFNYILEKKASQSQTRDVLFGAALWGRAICHACLDSEYAFEDFEKLECYFRDAFQKNCKEGKAILNENSSLDFYDRTSVVEFANPNEKISIGECKERVSGCANSLKLFIGPLIKNTAKRAIFIAFIDSLEDQGLYCCRNGTFWTTCVTPLIEKLQAWKAFGVPADPYWD